MVVTCFRCCTAVLLAAVLSTATAHAGARDRLAAFTRSLTGLDGQFSQQVLDETGYLRDESSGRVALAVPRLLRWQTITPYPQLIVADGTTVWIYDPDIEQVTRRAQGAAETDSPLLALTDPARLEREYVMEDSGTQDGLDWLTLRPKHDAAEAGFVSAALGFDPDGLVRMEIIDALGQTIRFAFSQWTRNPVFAAETFAFTPPEGVDVVGGD